MEIDFLDLKKKNQSKPCYKHAELVNTMISRKSWAVRDHEVADTPVERIIIKNYTKHPKRRILGSRFSFRAGIS